VDIPRSRVRGNWQVSPSVLLGLTEKSMDQQALIIDGWPALMSLELASRYLSADEPTFHRLVWEYGVEAVELNLDVLRWRKAALDRLIKRLPTSKVAAPGIYNPGRLAISDEDIDRIARAVAKYGGIAEPIRPPELVSIKDASRLSGLSRTTLYNLLNEGRLETRQIGRRRLVTRLSIASLMGD
jgi:helix-turn-helix protein